MKKEGREGKKKICRERRIKGSGSACSDIYDNRVLLMSLKFHEMSALRVL